ncbi:hypothetical protein E3N88_35703 [Mikania micrantha]|uniref:Reverse transcriptase Ty1/copia-type domain-containing protein n=1 Tax=Mikania micrantha TaxID=192012 RepID=A0A5N6M4G8_9ASTR|nr:hypothetical protein E3N88_35703 [Mikania micrantha]
MMNVDENRAQNGVLDCRNRKNEEKSLSVGRPDSSRYAMDGLRILRDNEALRYVPTGNILRQTRRPKGTRYRKTVTLGEAALQTLTRHEVTRGGGVTEAEYVALTEAVKECLWLKGFVADLGIDLSKLVVLGDNMGAWQLAKNQVFHKRTKHINVKLHFIRDVIKSKEVEAQKVDTLKNGAEMFTKVLPGLKFSFCLDLLNIG